MTTSPPQRIALTRPRPRHPPDFACLRLLVREMRAKYIFSRVQLCLLRLVGAGTYPDPVDSIVRAIHIKGAHRHWRVYSVYYYALFTGQCATGRQLLDYYALPKRLRK